MGFSRQEYGVGCHALLQGIFPTQDRACVSYVSCIGRRVLYPYCHLGSSSILILSFSRTAPSPGDFPWVSDTTSHPAVQRHGSHSTLFPLSQSTQVPPTHHQVNIPGTCASSPFLLISCNLLGQLHQHLPGPFHLQVTCTIPSSAASQSDRPKSLLCPCSSPASAQQDSSRSPG